MPFALIPTMLGVCFFLVWVFIGGMILRDGQIAAQRDRETGSILPLAPHSMHRIPGRGPTKRLSHNTAFRTVS